MSSTASTRAHRPATSLGRRGAVVLSASAVAAAALVSSVPAYASGGQGGGHGGAVVSSTRCGSGQIKVKAKHDSLGLIELGSELDVNVAGQVWSVRVVDNGVTVWAGSRTTLAPSGAFAVGNRLRNRAGYDHITVSATRGLRSCSAVVVL